MEKINILINYESQWNVKGMNKGTVNDCNNIKNYFKDQNNSHFQYFNSNHK